MFAQEQGLEQTMNLSNPVQQIKNKCHYLIEQCVIAIDNAYIAYDRNEFDIFKPIAGCHSCKEYADHTLPKGINFKECLTLQDACAKFLQNIHNLSEQEYIKQWKAIENFYKKIDARAYTYRNNKEFIRHDQRVPLFSPSEIKEHMLSELMQDKSQTNNTNIIENKTFQSGFVSQIRKPDKDFKDDFSPDQLKAALEAINEIIKHKKNSTTNPGLLFTNRSTKTQELGIYTLTEQLDANIWPIEIKDILKMCSYHSSGTNSLKKCKQIVENIYNDARKHVEETKKPLVIWFQPIYYSASRNYGYGHQHIYNHIIAMTIANELKRELDNKDIVFVTNEQPLAPSDEYESFGEPMSCFSTVRLLIPKLDIKGRTDLLKRYFAKCKLKHTIDLETLAKETEELYLDDLQNMVKKSEKIAQKENAALINEKHLSQAREKYDWCYMQAKEKERVEREREYEANVEKYHNSVPIDDEPQEIHHRRNNSAMKTIIALGCACTAGLLYLYNKTSSKKESKKSKKKTSKNKRIPYNQRPYEVHTL